MDRLSGIEAFVAVVETGSFTAAGKRLLLSRAVVGKRVAALEKALKVQLLHRSTRQVCATQQGLLLYEQCEGLMQEFALAMDGLERNQRQPEGIIRISAPMSYSKSHLVPVLLAFMTQYPRVTLQLCLSDNFVDPIAEGYDLVLRIAEPVSSSLIFRRLATMERYLCASPAYLERAGLPGTPADLANHSVLHYGNQRHGMRWRLLGPDGLLIVEPPVSFCADNGEVLVEAALVDHGIVLLPDFILASHIKTGRLQRVLPDYRGEPMALHALWPSNRMLPSRVRLLIDFLVEQLAA